MVAFPKLILIPAHSRMEERVYTDPTYPKISIDLESNDLFTANDTIDRGMPHPIDAWKTDGEQALIRLFHEAIVDIVKQHVNHDHSEATTARDELLALLGNPTNVNVRFQYARIPDNGISMSPTQLIADINATIAASDVPDHGLWYAVRLDGRCDLAGPYRKFLLLAGLIQ